jgi:GTPase SAR1 family protein
VIILHIIFRVAAALVFDISRIATFQSIKKWLCDLREKVTLPDGSEIPVVLLANKCDIPCPVVPTEQIVKFCKENNIGAWYVTSAKENTNVGKYATNSEFLLIREKFESAKNMTNWEFRICERTETFKDSRSMLF